MSFTDTTTNFGFNWKIPANAHATFNVPRTTASSYIEYGVNDPGLDDNWQFFGGPLSTGPEATSERLFAELPAFPGPRTVLGGFSNGNRPPTVFRVVPNLVSAGPPIPLKVGRPTTVSTTQPAQNRKLTFKGEAGQVIQVRTSNSTYPSFWQLWMPAYYLTLTQPDGSKTTLGYDPGTTSPVTLGAAGTYTITLDPSDNGTGSVVVELLDVTP